MPYYRCPACGALSHSVAAYSTAGVCAVCSAPLPDDAKLAALPPPSLDLSRRMRAGLAAPSQAREAVVTLPVIETTRAKLALLVSELVTNAIRHAGLGAGDPIDLHVMSRDSHVRIAVHDGGPGFDPGKPNGHGAPNGGFGLALVAALSEEWGVERRNGGCTVWCAVPT